MKVKLYTQEGKQKGTVELPDEVFAVPMNAALLHQAAVAMRSLQRQPRAHTKTRGEVRGGGRKPWRQKGTGRARHGSTRSPLWKGGGVTFGPRKEKRFAKRLPEAMKKKALAVALSQKVRDGELAVLEGFSVAQPKTKEAAAAMQVLLQNICNVSRKSKKPTVLMHVENAQRRALRNIPYVAVARPQDLNLLALLSHRYVFFPKTAIGGLVKRFS